MAFEDVLSHCIAKWRHDGIVLSPPVGEAEVRSAWDRFGRRASEDVIRLYTTIGGFAGHEFDGTDFYWSLWSWDMIRQENVIPRSEGVMFCDHSIQVLTWEARFEDEQRSSIWQIEEGHMTAQSLESFFRLYLEDSWQLLFAGRPPDGDPCK